MRSMKMSIMAGWKFSCANTTCIPFMTVGAANVRRCQMACLAQDRCLAASFQQSTSMCQLFFNSPNQQGNLVANAGTITMISKSETRTTTMMFPSETCMNTTGFTLATYMPYTTTTSANNGSSLWSFDNNTLDSRSDYNGVGINSPTYKTPGINGHGSALSVDASIGQYVSVSKYRNFTYTSFTIEMWFYLTELTSSAYGLFGQYYDTATDQSLHCKIYNDAMYFGFWGDDLQGSTAVQANTWYHAAFVFNYLTSTRTIYLNGILDTSGSSSYYQGVSGSIVIGKTEENPGIPYYFAGYIDEVSVVMREKQPNEILDDATLVTWNSFDNLPYSDSGSLNLNVKVSNLTSVSGRVNEAVRFSSNLSYYQMNGFVLLGISNYSYSIALWTRPSSTRGSVLVHLSTTADGNGWCVDLMGFSSSGQIIVTGWHSTSNVQIVGPILPANVWTHVVTTYSTTNALRLYINGTYYNSSSAFKYVASGTVNILTLGNPLQAVPFNGTGGCKSQSIVPNVYDGSIDEFGVYSRELSSYDICALANP
ncbi:unnamed protein product [Adineta steineri]|uniref:Apple domain-containing protein n=1 Tax=Adineta steineri TaxID=433720 RepID=A0A819NUN9_9BILA|nr:unnamed protein product [Adineta steineri]CAF4003492.1 unnamed protein product [Adineta steineri]